MTTALVATVRCDTCSAELVIGDSSIHARNAALVAKSNGWGYRNGLDLCPDCLALVTNPQRTLALEGA